MAARPPPRHRPTRSPASRPKPQRPASSSARSTRLLSGDRSAVDQRYRLLFEHNLVGVYRTTSSGRILDCNQSMAAIMGYRSRAELLRARAQDLYFSSTDRRAFLRRLRAAGVLTNLELTLKHKDGRPVHILENVVLVPDDAGRPRIIQGTMVDITDRKRAEEALRESERRYRELAGDLRRLAHRLQSIREEERSRIARELHDELGQALTVLNMDLHWLAGQPGTSRRPVQRRLKAMSALVGKTMRAVHRICADLRPSLLDDLGLPDAITWLVQSLRRRTSLRFQLSLPAETPGLSAEQAIDVFRVLQESLTNVVRHARATRVAVRLRISDQTLVLTVADNGIGIDPEQAAGLHSFGLAGLRERALRWGGCLTISNRRPSGAKVRLEMPLGTGGHSPVAAKGETVR